MTNNLEAKNIGAKNCNTCLSSNVAWSFIEEKCLCPNEDIKQPVKLLEISSNNRNINAVRNTISSNEFRSDRNPSCSRSTSNGSEGGLDFEFKVCDSNSLLFDAALANYNQQGADSNLITANVTDAKTYTLPVGAGNFADMGFCAGQIITVSGFADIANNGQKIICNITQDNGVVGSSLQVYSSIDDEDYPELVVATGTGIEQFVVTNNITKLGDVERTFTIQRQLGDQAFEVYKGVGVNGLSLSITPDSYISGSMDLLGFGKLELNEQTLGDVFEQENCCPSTADEVEIFLGCQKLCGITSLDFNLANNASQTKTVGDCPNCLKLGTANITGSIQGFFNDFTFQHYIDNVTELPLTVLVHNEDRTDYIAFVFPAVTFTTSSIDPVAGEPILQNLEFAAKVADDCETSFFMQRSFVAKPVVRNRLELETDCASIDVSSNAVDAITRTYETGDNAPAQVMAGAVSETFSYSFAAGFGAGVSKIVNMFAPEDSPITELNIAGNCITNVNLCYLDFITNLDISDNNLSQLCASNLTQLTSLDASNNANLTGINLERACAITNLVASNTALTQIAVDKLLRHLANCAQQGGSLDISGGTSASPSTKGLGYVAELIALGWVVTTN